MGGPNIGEWRKISVKLVDLSLDTTLRCGQSFRWRKLPGDEWTCALHGRIISLKQDQNDIHYKITWPSRLSAAGSPSLPEHGEAAGEDKAQEDNESLLRHYFNLKPDLADLYERWSVADANFKKRAPRFTGVRILRQDAWETLVGFICSSNNNIARISQMVNKLCQHYGPLIGHLHGQSFHDFPSPAALSVSGVESQLRALGFGYRAKYIAKTAMTVSSEKPENWLGSLSNTEDVYPISGLDGIVEAGGRAGYRMAHEELLSLQGVGPKVADCICLMGLGWGEAVPVDTHVWKIAQRDYNFGKGKHKSLTKNTYDAVGNHFRSLWGIDAGWAHSVLFAADLRTFATQLADKIDVKEEISIKEEDAAVVEEATTKKRNHMEEKTIKDEPANDEFITTTATKRTRIRRTQA